jgi:2-polyprenyl-3-methyl-5-hydroxy-6-metoxy-1,4-benzoquinol methylase
MADKAWDNVMQVFGDSSLTLAPMYAHMALNNPRHLLFTLARYKFAARMLEPGRTHDILELGCSEGFGTLLLAEGGNRVTGIDFDQKSIEHAQTSLSASGIDFRHADFLNDEPFGEFDAIISLDVIEHIERSREQEFFQSIVRNLRPDGFAVIGTPNEAASAHASEMSKVGHINLFTAERLASTARQWFRNVFIFGMNDEILHTGFYPMTHYVFILACGKRS